MCGKTCIAVGETYFRVKKLLDRKINSAWEGVMNRLCKTY